MTNIILTAIVNGAIAGALLVGAVWIGLRLLPRRMLSASARYAVWWMALAAMVVLPASFLPHYFGMTPAARSSAWNIAAPSRSADATPAPGSIKVNSPAPEVRSHLPFIVPIGGWGPWILSSWACVSVILLLRLVAAYALLARRKSGAGPAPGALMTRIAALLPQGRHIRVLRSSSIATPVLAGLRHPAILIPERLFVELSEDELTQIAMHEAAHLARRDDYALLFQRAIEVLMPWHPAILFAARQIDFERELACDDHVAARIGDPRRYAACLLRVAELCGTSPEVWATAGVMGRRSQLTARVERLLARNRANEMRPRKLRALLAAAAVAALAYTVAQGPPAVALPLLSDSDTAEAIQIATRSNIASAPEATPLPAPLPAQTQQPASQQSVSQQQVAPPREIPPQDQVAPQRQSATGKSVVLPAFVTDLENIPALGLGKENFRVFEDGVEQKIAAVTVENPRITVEFVVDRSGSMASKQGLVDAAVTRFMKAANPADDFVTFMFNDRVEVGTPTSDPAEILAQLHSGPARGGTSQRDAINAAENWTGTSGERMIVVLSDGADNASRLNGSQLLDVVLAGQAPLWALTFPSGEDGQRPEIRWLREAADASGGHEFVGEDPGPLTEAANPARYVIRYEPSNQTVDGKYRRVRIELMGVPTDHYKVHQRQGYYLQ